MKSVRIWLAAAAIAVLQWLPVVASRGCDSNPKRETGVTAKSQLWTIWAISLCRLGVKWSEQRGCQLNPLAPTNQLDVGRYLGCLIRA